MSTSITQNTFHNDLNNILIYFDVDIFYYTLVKVSNI
jgi:hypothetical protein